MAGHHLAQLNVARLLAPLESPALAGFVSRLDEINALAEAAPGFVWRFQTAEGHATTVRPYEDDRILINFSVWETPEALQAFVYRTAHGEVMQQRRQWFERLQESTSVLWWVPAGHRPTVAEAVDRLDHLRANGPSARAFTHRALFTAPDGSENGGAAPEPSRGAAAS